MSRIRGWSLSRKILGATTLAIVLILACGILLLNEAQSRATLHEQEQQIRTASDTTLRAIERIMQTGDPSDVILFIRPPSQLNGQDREDQVRISVAKPDGTVRWDTDPAGEGRRLTIDDRGLLQREGSHYALTRKLAASASCTSCHEVAPGTTLGYVKVQTSSLPSDRIVADSRRRLILFAAFQVVALVALVGWLMRSLVVRPMRRFVARVRAGESDLTRRLPEDGGDEFADLAGAFNHFLSLLEQLVSAIRVASGSVGREASQVAQAAREVSQATLEQASNLERSASSLEQLTATVQQNAGNAAQGQTLAARSRALAEAGAPVVESAVTAMSDVNRSAQRIEEIVGAIEAIAFQTNILALNAAVEAARAGEQGRGFAVVAAEVRQLAVRSSAAAHEVKQIVGEALERIGGGVELVTRSGSTLREIVEAIRNLDSVVATIAAASQEQSGGLMEANRSIQSVQGSTHAVADQSTHLADNAQAMLAEASNLQDLVGKFRVSGGA